MADCLFLDNRADGGGGAIALPYGVTATIESCTFEGNTARSGGGISAGTEASLFLTGSFFTANEAVSRGGGLSCGGFQAVEINSCTFSRNSAPAGSNIAAASYRGLMMEKTILAFGEGGGAGFSCEDFDTEADLRCCDVYGNDGGDWVGCIEDQLGTEGNISADPLFCDPGQGDYTLRSDSPCAEENNPQCGRIGAWPVGCEMPTPTLSTTWGRMKGLYR